VNEFYVRAAVIHQLEKQGGIPLVDTSLTGYLGEEILRKMFLDGYLNIDERRQCWVMSEKGLGFRNELVQALDQLAAFEVFANVDFGRELTPTESEDGLLPYEGIYDPRFQGEVGVDPDVHDLRIAMMEFAQEKMRLAPIDPVKLIFLQQLVNEEMPRIDFWVSLRNGLFEKYAGETYLRQIKWRQFDETSEASAHEIAEALYSAGMIERIKREGHECSNCNAPIGIEEYKQVQEKGRLSKIQSCPFCRASFTIEEPPAETVTYTFVEETVVTEVYEPQILLYDPFDPLADAIAFGILCTLW